MLIYIYIYIYINCIRKTNDIETLRLQYTLKGFTFKINKQTLEYKVGDSTWKFPIFLFFQK